MSLTITRELAFASGHDAAARAMRKAGRSRWNADDAAIAAETTNRLLLYVPFERGGLDGLDLSAKMRDDLGISDETWEQAQRAKRIGHNSAVRRAA